MAQIWLWNSIATRKRSPSDGFLENGLALLKGYVEECGHRVKVIDWQKNEFYDSLCYSRLRRLNRLSTAFIFRLGKKGKLYAKPYFPVFNLLQDIVSLVRVHRMKHHLKELAHSVVSSGVHIFGIKVWYGEAFVLSDWLARYLKKKDPSILVIAGGFHTTLYEEDFLKNSSFDLGVIAEGERPLEIILGLADEMSEAWDKDTMLKRIREKIEKGELKNIVYRDNGVIKVSQRYTPQMDKKAFPKYDAENIEGKLKIHVLLDSLGCPWGKCNFCVHWHFYPQFYPRPVEAIIAEIEYMIKKGVALFRFAGSETPPAFGVKIAQAMLDKSLKVRYSIGCRAVIGISKSEERYKEVVKDYEIMLKSGLVAIFMGGETGNDVINDKVMNKGVFRDDIVTTIRAFKEARKNTSVNAYVSLALIYPTPLVDGISMDRVYDENLALIKDTAPDSVIVSPCFPFKQAKWFEEPARFGFIMPPDFIPSVMRYEYVLYKPTSLWPLLDLRVQGLNFRQWLNECDRLRKAVEDSGVPVDLTDEHFLMIEGAGYTGKSGLMRFKEETAIDLASSDYPNIERITALTNMMSRELAGVKNAEEKVCMRRIRFSIRSAFQKIVPYSAAAFLKITIEGAENIPDASKLLIVANHSTFIDVPLLCWAFRKYLLRMSWVVNKSIYRLWYLKWVFMIHKVLVVGGGTIEKMKRELYQDRWVVIFPEGGQGLCPPVILEQETKKPRRGAAVTALSTGATILPVCIIGADKVLPARSFRFNIKHRVTVRIGKPFSYDKVDENMISDEMVNKTRQEIISKIYGLAREE